MATTNIPNCFISVAPDCPVLVAETPPSRARRSIPEIEFEMLSSHPYSYTSDDVLYAANGQRRGLSREAFFSRKQPDFRLSPLTKRYGWGVHSDAECKIALIAVESIEYQVLASDLSLRQLRANRSSRKANTRTTSKDFLPSTVKR
ncbi:MAG: DUF6157 family protein [Natronospirillum sp.]|uniref:DUF6157 family protein n=1 Tax=Natronospirillum sp. TaxID=2812955 RepID=UPI0025FBFE34|nr:DUF6157 family protein [Natronospirillum sp.]MCH8552291.1 DUF6157 family protein [Natronospirillum sp.]